MIGFSTQTLDEKPQLLLVADKTELATKVTSRLRQNQSMEIVFLSWEELSSKKNEIEKQDWYRLIFIFQHPFDKKQAALASSMAAQNSLVIIPLTSTVLGGEAQKWVEQVEKEVVLVNQLIEKIDLSSFIFYQDLVDVELYPLKQFLAALERRILLNPEVELNLTPLGSVVSEINLQIFKPSFKTRLIRSKSSSSRALVDEIRQLYQQFYQLKLPVKQLGLRTSPHPIVSRLGNSIDIIELNSRRESVLSEISHNLEPLPSSQTVRVERETMAVPSKHERLLDWNKTNPTVQIEKPKKIAPEEKLNQIVSQQRAEQKRDHLKELTKKTKVGFRKQEHHRVLFSGGMIVSVIATVFLLWFGVYLVNALTIKRQFFKQIEFTQTSLENNHQLAASVERNNWLINSLNRQTISLLSPNLNQLLMIAGQVVEYKSDTQVAQELTFEAFQQFLGKADGSSLASVAELGKISSDQYQQISLIGAELKNINQDRLSSDQKNTLESYLEHVSQGEAGLAKVQQLWPLLPELMATNQRKVYAVILQNNQELRPTGGFIETVALLTVEDGELVSTQVKNVYDLDNQVFGVVEPPAEIKRYLNEERWYLRDANWSADFNQAAQRITWFLEQSANTKIDGVIGLNITVLEEMLVAMEKVSLPEQNEVITSRNIAERMEYHSELSLSDPESNPTYPQLVLTRVLAALEDLSSEQANQLLTGLISQANQQELLIMMKDDGLQSSLAAMGWTGELVEPNCPVEFNQNNCLVDAVAQVEANVGINKANYYLNRQIDHSIELTAEKVLHKRVVVFENQAQVEAWPKGPYLAYTRFYLSPTARLEKVLVNGQSVEVNNITIKQEDDRQVVGIYTQTPVKSKTNLQLEYSMSHELKNPFSYVFFDQKQPGARETSPRVFIKHTPDLTPVLIAPQAEVQGNVIIFNPTKSSGHTFVGVSFE